MSKPTESKPPTTSPTEQPAVDPSAAQPPPAQEGKNVRRRLPTNHSYMKYTGMAFQMAAAILFGLFLGRYFDAWLQTEPALTLVGCLLGVFAGLYIALKDFL